MIEAKIYQLGQTHQDAVYVGKHRFLGVPRPGDYISIWRKRELLHLNVVAISQMGQPVDLNDDVSNPQEHPNIVITARVPPGPSE